MSVIIEKTLDFQISLTKYRVSNDLQYSYKLTTPTHNPIKLCRLLILLHYAWPLMLLHYNRSLTL